MSKAFEEVLVGWKKDPRAIFSPLFNSFWSFRQFRPICGATQQELRASKLESSGWKRISMNFLQWCWCLGWKDTHWLIVWLDDYNDDDYDDDYDDDDDDDVVKYNDVCFSGWSATGRSFRFEERLANGDVRGRLKIRIILLIIAWQSSMAVLLMLKFQGHLVGWINRGGWWGSPSIQLTGEDDDHDDHHHDEGDQLRGS